MVHTYKTLITLLIFIFPALVLGQTVITGKVVDNETGKAIPGALVKIESGSISANSNPHGYFQITVDVSDSLIISASGYEPLGFKVPAAKNFKVLMVPKEKEEIFLVVENSAVPKYGINYITKYLNDSLPCSLDEHGNMWVDFIVDYDGAFKVDNVLKSNLEKSCESRILQLLSSGPKWQPALHRGIPVLQRQVLKVMVENNSIKLDWITPSESVPEFSKILATRFVSNMGMGYTEEYYVLKEDKKIKHGTFVKYQGLLKGIELIESGSYTNGEKNGLWEYFHHTPFLSTKITPLSSSFTLVLHKPYNTIKERGYYVNGKRNGEWVYFYPKSTSDVADFQSYKKKSRVDSVEFILQPQASFLMMTGAYKEGKRTGEWIAYDTLGNICQKYNFSKNELIFDHTLKDSLAYNKNRMPLFVGGSTRFESFFNGEFNIFSVVPDLENSVTSVRASFKIDKEGQVSDPTIVYSKGPKKLEKEIIRLINISNTQWIPAVVNGEVVDATHQIEITIEKKKNKEGQKSIKSTFRSVSEIW